MIQTMHNTVFYYKCLVDNFKYHNTYFMKWIFERRITDLEFDVYFADRLK